MTVEELKQLAKKYNGTFRGNATGMSFEEYTEAMTGEWTDLTEYGVAPEPLYFDLTAAYHYSDLSGFMKALSRYDGVYCYKIGQTVLGKEMLSVEINMPSDKEKPTIILTGNIHAKETAGSSYIIKELIELVQAYYQGNKDAIRLLENYRFATVPCVNPDGREGTAFDKAHFTHPDGSLYKSAANNVDLNRNFPGLSWCITAGNLWPTALYSDDPKAMYYIGDHAGQNPEIKAMMKFLAYFVVDRQAKVMLDYHQQGKLAYAGKPWILTSQHDACRKICESLCKSLNNGKSGYAYVLEDANYGLCGTGTTMTDYAIGLAYGAKFSSRYGFSVYEGVDGTEYPLIAIPKMDKCKVELTQAPNPNFVYVTFEIGKGDKYLGYSDNTRSLIAKEWTDYNFDKLLYFLGDYLGY